MRGTITVGAVAPPGPPPSIVVEGIAGVPPCVSVLQQSCPIRRTRCLLARPLWLLARMPLPPGYTVGRAGRSHGPYAINVPTVGPAQAENRGRLPYQLNTTPQNCPPMNPPAARGWGRGGRVHHAVPPILLTTHLLLVVANNVYNHVPGSPSPGGVHHMQITIPVGAQEQAPVPLEYAPAAAYGTASHDWGPSNEEAHAR